MGLGGDMFKGYVRTLVSIKSTGFRNFAGKYGSLASIWSQSCFIMSDIKGLWQCLTVRSYLTKSYAREDAPLIRKQSFFPLLSSFLKSSSNITWSYFPPRQMNKTIPNYQESYFKGFYPLSAFKTNCSGANHFGVPFYGHSRPLKPKSIITGSPLVSIIMFWGLMSLWAILHECIKLYPWHRVLVISLAQSSFMIPYSKTSSNDYS